MHAFSRGNLTWKMNRAPLDSAWPVATNIGVAVVHNGTQSLTDEEEEQFDMEMLWLYVIFWVRFLLSSMGVMLNIQVVIVYHSKAQKSPSEYIILNLGSADLLCTVGTTASALYDLFETEQQLGSPLSTFVKSFQRFSFIAITIYSFLCVLTITVNRFLAVCRPHQFRGIFTLPRTYSILVFSALFALLLGSVEFTVTFFDSMRAYRRLVTSVNGYVGILLTVVDICVMLLVYLCILFKTHQFSIPAQLRRRRSCMLSEIQLLKRRQNQPSCPSLSQCSAVQGNGTCRPEISAVPENDKDYPEAQLTTRKIPKNGQRVSFSVKCGPDESCANAEVSYNLNCDTSRVQDSSHAEECQPLKAPFKRVECDGDSNRPSESKKGAVGTSQTPPAFIGTNSQMSNRTSRRNTNVTISLFVISALFICFTLPYKVLHLRFLLDRSKEPDRMAFELSLLLFECNFIVNYFVYLYFNSFFRAQLKNFWKMKCSSYQ